MFVFVNALVDYVSVFLFDLTCVVMDSLQMVDLIWVRGVAA